MQNDGHINSIAAIVSPVERKCKQIKIHSFIEIGSHFIGRRDNSFDLYFLSIKPMSHFLYAKVSISFFPSADCCSNEDLCIFNAQKLFSVCIQKYYLKYFESSNSMYYCEFRINFTNDTNSFSVSLPTMISQVVKKKRNQTLCLENLM